MTTQAQPQMRFYNAILDKYGAPELSLLTECRAEEVPDLLPHMQQVMFNLVFGQISFKDDNFTSIVLNFMRRLEFAIAEYQSGREDLKNYVERLPETNTHIFRALRSLSHFEQGAAALWQAADLASKIIGEKVYEKNDDSPLEGLNGIYNRSKHFNEEEIGPQMPATPVWLTNDGLKSTNCELSFAEMREIIEDFSKMVEFMANELPNKKVDPQSLDPVPFEPN